MKALLRFQAVLLRRMVAGPWVVTLLVSVGVLLWVCTQSLGPTGALPVYLVAVGILLPTMTYTLGALDSFRWAAPVRSVQALGAHVLFWTLACVVPAGAVAASRATYADGAPWLFVDLMLLVAVVATAATMFQRAARHGRIRDGALLSVLVVGSITPMGAAILFAWSGDGAQGAAILGVALVVWATAAAATFLRDEWSPAGCGTSIARVERERSGPTNARPPVVSLLRVHWLSQWSAFFWIAFTAFWLFFLPGAPNAFAFMWMLIPISNLPTQALSSWRWLVATPIDRGRAFRILFLPIVLFAVTAVTTKFLVQELGSDRSVFFDDFRKADRQFRRDENLSLYGVLQTDQTGKAYRPPEVPLLAARVRAHLHAQFGLDVPEARIESAMLRDWPAQPPTSIMDAEQTPTLDAMERVRADLERELVRADRLRSLVNSVVVVLLALLLIRMQLLGFRRGRLAFVTVFVPVWLVIFLPAIARNSAAAARIAAAQDAFYAAFQDSPAPVPSLLFLAAAIAGVLLWRSSVRAFRRLDVTELPPRSNAWSWGTKQV